MMDKDKDVDRTVGGSVGDTFCTAVDLLIVTPSNPSKNFERKITKIQKKSKKGSSFALMFFVSTKSSLVLTKSTRKSR